MPFAIRLTATIALLALVFIMALTVDAFCYLSHAYALYQQQGTCSILLVTYSA